MSILIKGMEMPVTCCHCPLMGYDPDREWYDSMARTGAHICVLTGELIDNTKREEQCPLIPVPPHGRLIDADALKTEVFAHDKLMKDGWNNMDMGIFTGNLLEVVAGVPTIIPAEEGEI